MPLAYDDLPDIGELPVTTRNRSINWGGGGLPRSVYSRARGS